MSPTHTHAAEKQTPIALRVIAFIFVILLVISLPLAVLAVDTGRVVFDRVYVKSVVTDEVVNSYLLPALMEWYSEDRAQERVDRGEALTGITEPDIAKLISFMKADDWQQVKVELLTNEILTEWTGVAVDGTYDWIDSQDKVPQIAWAMQNLKDRLNSEHGINCIVIAFNRLPPCGPTEIADLEARLAAAPPGTEVLYNLCNFPDPWHEDQFNDYKNSLADVVKEVPPLFNLTRELENTADKEGIGPEAIKQELRTIRFWMQWAWVIPLALLLLVILLAVRSRKTLANWLGAPLLVAGVLTLLPALVYRPLITSLLASGPLSEVPDVVITETTRIALRIADAIFMPMLILAVIILLLGLGLTIWLFTLKRAKVVEPLAAPPVAPAAEPVEKPIAEPVEEPTAEPVEEPTAEPAPEPVEPPPAAE
jgi:hypothetical protein